MGNDNFDQFGNYAPPVACVLCFHYEINNIWLPIFWGHDSFTIVKERSDHPESLGINFSRNIHTPIILVMVQNV